MKERVTSENHQHTIAFAEVGLLGQPHLGEHLCAKEWKLGELKRCSWLRRAAKAAEHLAELRLLTGQSS